MDRIAAPQDSSTYAELSARFGIEKALCEGPFIGGLSWHRQGSRPGRIALQ